MSSIGWELPDVAEDSTDGTIEYLTLRDLLGLVKALNVGPVRDLGLLDSAAHRPRSSFAGQQAYPTVQAKAAALMHSVVCNHALVDGNKRLGLLAAAVFLRINGLDLDLDDDEAFELTMSVAAGQLSADDIEKRLRTRPGLKSGRSHRGRKAGQVRARLGFRFVSSLGHTIAP